jgi:hypothetical protein
MPQYSSTRKIFLAPGRASSPALKDWGFRPRVINSQNFKDLSFKNPPIGKVGLD